jgi:ubiquitin-like domain-containing CTD phosphatase 1
MIDGLTDRAIYKSDFAFRLLSDGEVLTSKIKGCPADADLCDVQVLLDRVIPFATTNRNCARKPKSSPTQPLRGKVMDGEDDEEAAHG